MKRKIMLSSILALTLCSPLISMADDTSTVTPPPIVHHHHNKATLASDVKLNLNTADAKTLTELKGIGPKKAQAIIDFRQQHGDFKSIDDLKQVKGISQKIIAENRDHVSF